MSKKMQRKLITYALAGLLAIFSYFFGTNSSNQTAVENASSVAQVEIAEGIDPDWSYDKFPDYVAEISVDPDEDFRKDQLSESNPFSFGKDDIGRTITAYGRITKQMVDDSIGVRADFKQSDTPSGWPKRSSNWNPANPKVTVKTTTGNYVGNFWNRSHLIADQLGGPALSENAVTGTRMQNVGNRSNSAGMRTPEVTAVNYINDNPNTTLYYKAEPIYNGAELIPRLVVVSMQSEDGTFARKFVTYNYQVGFEINYDNGHFSGGGFNG